MVRWYSIFVAFPFCGNPIPTRQFEARWAAEQTRAGGAAAHLDPPCGGLFQFWEGGDDEKQGLHGPDRHGFSPFLLTADSLGFWSHSNSFAPMNAMLGDMTLHALKRLDPWMHNLVGKVARPPFFYAPNYFGQKQ